MNKRQKKKHAIDIAALKLAKSMDDWSFLSKQERKMFLKVCRRAVIEKFPLNNFFIWEIPLCNNEFWVFCFFGKEYNKENPEECCFRQIDFWIYKCKKKKNKYVVMPAALDKEKNNCFEAIYYD